MLFFTRKKIKTLFWTVQWTHVFCVHIPTVGQHVLSRFFRLWPAQSSFIFSSCALPTKQLVNTSADRKHATFSNTYPLRIEQGLPKCTLRSALSQSSKTVWKLCSKYNIIPAKTTNSNYNSKLNLLGLAICQLLLIYLLSHLYTVVIGNIQECYLL